MDLDFIKSTEPAVSGAWRMAFERLWCEKTKLFYDFLSEDTPDGAISHLPTPEMIARQVPNPCGWGTGMEDSVLNGGVMLEALITLYQKTGEASILPALHEVAEGLLACAQVSGQEGFLARSLSPEDGVSHYSNSSRDQYTHWVYMCSLFLRSGLASEAERTAIIRALVSFARKAEREIRDGRTEYLREDGRAGLVCQMWGDIQCHEFLRLPMIYLAAYAAGGDTHWRDRYREYREEAFRRSERIREPGGTDIFSWAYALLQMQYSLRLIYDLEEDAAYRDRAAALMGFVADFAQRYTAAGVREADAPHKDECQVWTKCPAAFYGFVGGYAYYVPQLDGQNLRSFAMRNAAEAVIIRALCPDGAIRPEQAAMFRHVLEKTDFSRAADYWPILYCDAWALLLNAEGESEG